VGVPLAPPIRIVVPTRIRCRWTPAATYSFGYTLDNTDRMPILLRAE
jgi:hypothetical protein